MTKKTKILFLKSTICCYHSGVLTTKNAKVFTKNHKDLFIKLLSLRSSILLEIFVSLVFFIAPLVVKHPD